MSPHLGGCLLIAVLILDRHIVQELQKENSASAHRCKVLEAENKLLLSETAQLRDVRRLVVPTYWLMLKLSWQDLKVLEDDVEQSLLREEAMLSNEPSAPSTPSPEDAHALQQRYKDLKAKHEVGHRDSGSSNGMALTGL